MTLKDRTDNHTEIAMELAMKRFGFRWSWLIDLALILAGVLLAVLLASLAGCARPGGSRDRGLSAPLLALSARLDKEVYQPGEAAVCSVELANASKKSIEVSPLSTDTLEFWFGPAGTDLRFKRTPVRSAKERACEMAKLAPGEKTQRDFLLVDVTPDEAVNAVHVFYRATYERKPETPCYIAPAALFKVDGPTVLRRDRNGVILKDQAVTLAKEWAEDPVERADAVLIRNEAGFLDWWVTLDMDMKADAEPEAPRVGVLINAHTGAVRAEAKPRPKSTAAAARQEKGGMAKD